MREAKHSAMAEFDTAGSAALWRDPRSALLRALTARIGIGRIAIVTPDGERIVARGAAGAPDATLILHRWSALRRLATGGAIGFAESYMDGAWSSPDLVALLELAARNLDKLAERLHGSALLRAANRLRHLSRANTPRGSRRNIAAHYDLGNAFYRLWLDAGMSYSSALYTRLEDTLEEAQAAKNRRIVELLGLGGGEHVLEIGCGWGGLAREMAAAGARRVAAITLSQEQHRYAAETARAAGLGESIDVRLTDYREVKGTYDRIASIEMAEAVGEANWPVYFATLRDRLNAGGIAVLQVITIADARFAAYRRRTDFIQRYIFPGGMLPSPTILREHVARAGLVLTDAEAFGVSYARTLAEWRRRFHAAWPAIAAQDFSLRFRRMWDYYLAYCEAGFRAGSVDVGLYRMVKPG